MTSNFIKQPPNDTISDLRDWRFRSVNLQLGRFPLIMGIVNVTPDSFSDGGKFRNANAAVEHGLSLIEAGADLLDVGGESTRPDAEPVPLEEELRRVLPVVRRLAQEADRPIAIDTTKAEVARQTIRAGASIVNDISGLRFDTSMPEVCAQSDVGIVCMHIQGTPQTMQDHPVYDNVVGEICSYFQQQLETLEHAGIDRERIVLDPGIGFGKTAEHNLDILTNIQAFRALGRPVLIGHSRKRFLKHLLGRPINERTYGTAGVSVALAMQSVDILRVHDVQATRDVLLAWRAVARRGSAIRYGDRDA